ncbi:MAG: phosphoadenylyl-sulfate reductase [Alphaproteobacteria bacterium]
MVWAGALTPEGAKQAVERRDTSPVGWNAARRARELISRYGRRDGAALVEPLLGELAGRIAVVSSFGAESAALLHMVASIDATVPVIFVDTGKLFDETLRYREELTARLRLADVRVVRPELAVLAHADPGGDLWRRDPDRCCHLRKVEPYMRAVAEFDAVITGRKRFQATTRARLPTIEVERGLVKINPLARWTVSQVDDYYARHRLTRHPLYDNGFLSIGCIPCTRTTDPSGDRRSGRWAGSEKTECGIHSSGLATARIGPEPGP